MAFRDRRRRGRKVRSSAERHLASTKPARQCRFAVRSCSPSFAQSQADQLATAYQAARNQLGILSYYAEKGHVGADVAEIQRKVLALIPPPADKSVGDTAEAVGKKGTIAMMGVTQDLDTMAKAQGGAAATYCKQIGDVVPKAAASLPK